MEVQFDFSLAIQKYTEARRQLHVMVEGGIYRTLEGEEIKYHGINYSTEMKDTITNSKKKEESYVSLANADYIMTEIQEVRMSALMLQVQLKSITNRPDLIKNPHVQGHFGELKLLLMDITNYLQLCDSQYTYMTEMLFGLAQVNVSVNRRFYNGDNVAFMYKSQE